MVKQKVDEHYIEWKGRNTPSKNLTSNAKVEIPNLILRFRHYISTINFDIRLSMFDFSTIVRFDVVVSKVLVPVPSSPSRSKTHSRLISRLISRSNFPFHPGKPFPFIYLAHACYRSRALNDTSEIRSSPRRLDFYFKVQNVISGTTSLVRRKRL